MDSREIFFKIRQIICDLQSDKNVNFINVLISEKNQVRKSGFASKAATNEGGRRGGGEGGSARNNRLSINLRWN